MGDAGLPCKARPGVTAFLHLAARHGRWCLVLGLLGGLFLLSWSWRKLVAEGTESTLLSWLLNIPVIGWLVRNQQRLHYLQNLSLLLRAGLPAFEACRRSRQRLRSWAAVAGLT